MKRALLLVLLAGCEIDYGVGSAPSQPLVEQAGPANKPLDILFVVDNSGSMAEEQENLARTIYKSECPISDLNQVPEALLDPEPGVLEDLVKVCGFAQILAAYDRDFRVGVITTDVDACDNFLPDVQGGVDRGFHPQRGCLQPVPSTGQKLIQRSDVDVAGKFEELIANIGTFGSPFERGLDAADIFLNQQSWVSEGCEGDRDSFVRDEAQLLVVFVTDEDDCSHEGTAFPDETLTECGANDSIVTEHSPGDCYTSNDLGDVAKYGERLRGLKGLTRAADVSVSVIAGAVAGGADFLAAGCLADSGGVPLSQCRPSGGLSNFTGAGQPCDPDAGEVCCTADPASRYFELRDVLSGFTGGSICSSSYIDTLVEATQKTEDDG